MARKKYAGMAISLLAIAAVSSMAFAAAFVYYPLNVALEGQSPPIVFAAGGNAGGGDLWGNTITVSIGANGTSLGLTLHPTYQKTYYKDVALIVNNDNSNSYYVMLRVTTPLSGIQAKLILSDGTEIDLTTTGDYGWITLGAGSSLTVDVEVNIPEGVTLDTYTASLELIYSPQNTETPP